MRAGERAKIMRAIADLVRAHGEELLKVQALDNSVPLSFAEIYVTSGRVRGRRVRASRRLDRQAGRGDAASVQGGDHMVFTLREPVGVVGAVIPWNAPLMLLAQKVAPALAAGCTIVLKPSEYATFAVLRLAGLMMEAGLPEGVFNVVTGPGDPPGTRWSTIRWWTSCRSPAAARSARRSWWPPRAAASGSAWSSVARARRSSSRTRTSVPLPRQTMGTVTLGLSGQVCVAQTRAIVHRDALEEFLAASQMIASMVSYGNPFDPEVTSSR